jgi:tetratricopeptide repeat protein 7
MIIVFQSKQAGVSLDAYLLMGKLSYACGSYDEALDNFRKADLENLAEKMLPCRSIRIVAESFAIRGNFYIEVSNNLIKKHIKFLGLCMEKNLTTRHSKFKQSDAQEKIEKSLKIATDLTFLYLQELDVKNTPNFNSNTGTLTTGGKSGHFFMETTYKFDCFCRFLLATAPKSWQTAWG